MRRRLDDVSHFFLDADGSRPSTVPPNRLETLGGKRPRVTFVISVADRVPGSMVVAGIAALAARAERCVFVAEASAHALDAEFAVRPPGASRATAPIVDTLSNIRFLTVPLAGSALPRFYLDTSELDRIEFELRGCDQIFVHLGAHELPRVRAAIRPPDDVVVIAPDDDQDAQLEAYRAIKSVVAWNTGARIMLVASGKPHSGPALACLREALKRFLRQEGLDGGWIPDGSQLPVYFLSGTLLGAGWDELTRVLGPLARRVASLPFRALRPVEVAAAAPVPISMNADEAPGVHSAITHGSRHAGDRSGGSPKR